MIILLEVLVVGCIVAVQVQQVVGHIVNGLKVEDIDVRLIGEASVGVAHPVHDWDHIVPVESSSDTVTHT